MLILPPEIPLYFSIVPDLKYPVSFQIVATDRDLGFNGALLYVISEGDADCAFALDAVTGDLAIAEDGGFLDRERTSEYILNVTVYDQVSFLKLQN